MKTVPYETTGLPLDVDIFKAGKLVKTVRLADPRVAYCNAMNELDIGLVARVSEQVAGEKMEAAYKR
jgi:hypothetical protein